MKKSSLLLILCFIIATSLGENRGFPVQAHFQNCIKPNHITQSEMDSAISDLYFYIRDTYVAEAQSTPGAYYVLSGMGTGGSEGLITHSEAHGYGMITTVLMAGDGPLADPDAQTYFDGMYTFYDAHRSVQSKELMSWQVLSDSADGESFEHDYNATDGDMDIAYALLLAHYQWGSDGSINYLAESQRIISKGIKLWNINPKTKRPQLGDWVWYFHEGTWEWYQDWDKGGEWVQDTSRWIVIDDYYWGSRPSDWMSGHMHAFHEHTGDPFWGEVADTVYALTDNFLTNYSATGLISDFIDGEDGGPAGENYIGEFPETNQYFENACRVPFRLAADYAHYGSEVAKRAAVGMVSFIKEKTGEDPSKITWGYNITTGEELYPDTMSNRFVAPFIAGAIVDTAHQQFLNDGWDYISSQRESYYSDYLTLLSMLLVSGNWWPASENSSESVLSNNTNKIGFSGVTLRDQGSRIGLSFTIESTRADVSLFTISGRKVATKEVVAQSKGVFECHFTRDLLCDAVYVVQVSGGERAFSTRIAVQ